VRHAQSLLEAIAQQVAVGEPREGVVVRLMSDDANFEVLGKLRLQAAAIEMEAGREAVSIFGRRPTPS